MLRRLVVPFVAALALGASLLPPATASAPSAERSVSAEAVSAAAKSKACSSRLVNPRKPVAPKTFAKCAVAGMKKGRTVRVRTAYDDGTWSKGPYRFGKTTDASVTHQDGARHVALGKDFWMKPAGEGWSKGKKNGNAAEQLAYGTGVLWRATSSPAAYRRMLASSSEDWTWTGVQRKVNGVKARRYTGLPTATDMEFTEYSVWLDRNDRPIRITSTGTAYGFTITMTQDFRKWGKKVSIKAPKVK